MNNRLKATAKQKIIIKIHCRFSQLGLCSYNNMIQHSSLWANIHATACLRDSYRIFFVEGGKHKHWPVVSSLVVKYICYSLMKKLVKL